MTYFVRQFPNNLRMLKYLGNQHLSSYRRDTVRIQRQRFRKLCLKVHLFVVYLWKRGKYYLRSQVRHVYNLDIKTQKIPINFL